MSQYPPPYMQQPGQAAYPGFNPYQAILAPARRAAIMMFVLGGIGLLCGSCLGILSIADLTQLPADQQAKYSALQTQLTNVWPEMTLQRLFGDVAIAGVAYALVLIVLGFFVRGGGRGASITSLCLVIPTILLLGFLIVSGIFDQGVQAAPGAVMMAIFLVMLVVLARWLLQALRNAKQLEMVQSQYQMQYYQYQQQAMVHGHNPYGSAAPYGGGYGPPQPGFVPGQGVPMQPPPPPQQTPPPQSPPPGGTSGTGAPGT